MLKISSSQILSVTNSVVFQLEFRLVSFDADEFTGSDVAAAFKRLSIKYVPEHEDVYLDYQHIENGDSGSLVVMRRVWSNRFDHLTCRGWIPNNDYKMPWRRYHKFLGLVRKRRGRS